ncbi:MAG: MmgE/PrpD family protein, partial [Actinomycetota bacterium]|nr:MmgE/PrpD family protein [Actinomycetota bacterium]
MARWATELVPTDEDLALADRSLVDTLAVTVGARRSPLVPVVAELPEAARWAALGHVLDFDDLHMESTAHISVVCVPAALASGGGARAYLAGAGVMARLGTALGWPHYSAGWHATCTSGA